MNWVITILIILSFAIGAKAILDNKYRPSIYSRIIWLLLSINNFASVIILRNNFTVILLASLSLLGNIVILSLSLKKSQKIFGRTELISSLLLVFSLAVWIFTRLPLLNLTIGLIAHLIGGIPTLKKAVKNPDDEDILFWLFFYVVAILTLINIDKTNFSAYLYPLYFALFDGIIVLLCLRRYIK